MQPRVTLVVVPRERFSRTEVSLDCLYQNTTEPFDLIYVDGHSPSCIRRYLTRQAHARGFRLIRLPHFIPTPQSRNLALRHVDTPYVVFIENDVLVHRGWLEALIQCAEETGASVVAPLYLEHQGEREIIHMAGGRAHLTDVKGTHRCIETHFLQGRNLSDVGNSLCRQSTELIEFHCVLIRTDILRQLGGFDEGIKNTSEHVDFCLTLGETGQRVYFEPASVVVYVQPPPFAWYDLPFYHTRWNEAWARQTLAHFRAKWDLDAGDPFLANKSHWTAVRRRLIFDYFLTRARAWKLGRPVADRCLTPVVDFCIGKTIARPARTTLGVQ